MEVPLLEACIKEVRETCIGFVQRQLKIYVQGPATQYRKTIPQCLKPFLSNNGHYVPAQTESTVEVGMVTSPKTSKQTNKGQYAKSAPTMTIFAVFATIWWINLH